MSFNALKDAFAPLAAILLIKIIDVREAYEEPKTHKDYLDAGTDGKPYEEWCNGVDNHELAFEDKANKWDAFAERGDEQRKWCLAADYTDEWFN